MIDHIATYQGVRILDAGDTHIFICDRCRREFHWLDVPGHTGPFKINGKYGIDDINREHGSFDLFVISDTTQETSCQLPPKVKDLPWIAREIIILEGAQKTVGLSPLRTKELQELRETYRRLRSEVEK